MFCSSCCMLWRHPAGCDNSSVSPNILWLLTLNICEKLQCHFFSLIVLLSGEINIFHNRVNVPFRHSSLCWRPGSCPFVGRVRHFRVALLPCSCQTLGFVLTASALYFCHRLPVYLLGLNFDSHQRPIKVKERLCWGKDDVIMNCGLCCNQIDWNGGVSEYTTLLYSRGAQSCIWRSTFLQSFFQYCSNTPVCSLLKNPRVGGWIWILLELWSAEVRLGILGVEWQEGILWRETMKRIGKWHRTLSDADPIPSEHPDSMR